MIFKGTATALITPFKRGELDLEAFDRLLDAQLEGGVDAVVALGTTGEPATLSEEEKRLVLERAVAKLGGKLPVIAGCGSNSTESAVSSCRRAESLGADAALVVTPYYNKCTQNGLYEHFKTIANSTSLPIICYNVPSRTGVNMLPATFGRLAREVKNIVAVKEASGNMEQIEQCIAECSPEEGEFSDIREKKQYPAHSANARGKGCNDAASEYSGNGNCGQNINGNSETPINGKDDKSRKFGENDNEEARKSCKNRGGACVYSGDDGITVPVMAMGGAGVISVASNVLPREVSTLTRLCLEGNFKAAARLQLKLLPIVKALFCEVNPIPVKYAASLLGFGDGSVRLPLTMLSEERREIVRALLRRLADEQNASKF